jgi:hypothetical protein
LSERKLSGVTPSRGLKPSITGQGAFLRREQIDLTKTIRRYLCPSNKHIDYRFYT